MDDLESPIKKDFVGKIRISTIYVQNLHDHMQEVFEEAGTEWSPGAIALREIREEIRDSPEMLDCVFMSPGGQSAPPLGRIEGFKVHHL